MVLKHENISKTNKAIVGIEKFDESSQNIGYRYWVPTKSFFKIQYDINLLVLKRLQQEGITIPFPQREVTVMGGEL